MGLRGNAIAIYMCWSSDQSRTFERPPAPDAPLAGCNDYDYSYFGEGVVTGAIGLFL